MSTEMLGNNSNRRQNRKYSKRGEEVRAGLESRVRSVAQTGRLTFQA